MSKTRTGMKKTPEACANISKGKLAANFKHTEESKKRLEKNELCKNIIQKQAGK